MKSQRVRRISFTSALMAAASLAGVSASSWGATHCVSPNSTPSFGQRLIDWQNDSANTSTLLKLEQGTYPISIAVDYRNGSTGDLDIEGGYLPGFNCSDSHRSKDAGGTVLDGGGNGGGTFAIAFETNVRLAVLKLQGFQSTTGYDGVFIGAINSPGNVSVDHVISYANSQFDVRGGSGAIVKDVLVYGQPAGLVFDAMSLSTESGSATGTNITVTKNLSAGLHLGDRDDVDIPGIVYNSIIYNNTGTDVYPDSDAQSSQGEVHDSIVGVLDNRIAAVNVRSTDPKFVDANADFHLDTTPTNVSPAINAGNSSPPNGLPGTDIEGNSRVQGGAPDLGAYEMNTPFHATYVVTNNQDNGSDAAPIANSLRWALMHARGDALLGSGRKLQIAFNLPCPSLIVLNSAAPLHDIDFDLTLDATTNPGWSANTGLPGFNANLCVGINGNDAIADGLHVVAGGRLTVTGLRFGGFSDAAIRIDAGSGDLIFGNQIGGAGIGVLNFSNANKDGVHIGGSASGVFVGAYDDASTRNMIVDNSGVGVRIDSSGGSAASASYVVDNLIGVGSNGTGAYANGDGVYVFNSGYTQIEYNTISGNTNTGVTLSGGATKFTLLANNFIGLPETGNNNLSNGTYGVLVSLAAFDNTIGAGQTQASAGNGIYADGTGVYISPSGGPGNRVLANKIITGSGLGIDLGAAGPTANDTNDADTGPNALQNYPLLRSAFRLDPLLLVDGTLDSAANTAYRLDFYWSATPGPGGRGAAALWLGRANATTDVTGHVHFAVQVPSPAAYVPSIAAGQISATATDAAGNTSELGPSVAETTDEIFRDGFE